MRVSLRVRLLLPLAVLLLGDAAATSWGAWTAADQAEARIAAQLRAIAATVTEPPTFPLTPPVLEQMKRLSGAEFALERRPGDREASTFHPAADVPAYADIMDANGERFRILRVALPPGHPNAGGALLVCYPESLRRAAVADAVRPTLWLGLAVAVAAVPLIALGSRVVARVRQLQAQARTLADGDFRPLPLPRQDDELRDLVAAVNDMTRKLADYSAQLRQTERLRVLGQFSGGLAHQLRNAAGGAKLAVQLALSEARDEAGGADREPLRVALRQLARMEATLAQFLAVGKPPPVALTPVDVGGVVSAAVALAGPQCRHAGIELTWVPPDSPVSIVGDAGQLGHLVSNLIGNAVDAAGPGGRVDVTLTTGANEIVLEVTDTGPGPPPAIADRLFDLFVTGREQGVGLGLAVARQAAELHRGRIDWERRGDRTAFRARFPSA